VGRSCSPEEHEAARAILASFVHQEIESDNPANDNQGKPGSDDFCTDVTASQPSILSSHQQIVMLAEMRLSQLDAISIWFTALPP
jgi:hypothetical protein